MTYWDGKKYVGQWKNGAYDGFGVLIAKDRKILFSGRWSDGKQTGEMNPSQNQDKKMVNPKGKIGR